MRRRQIRSRPDRRRWRTTGERHRQGKPRARWHCGARRPTRQRTAVGRVHSPVFSFISRVPVSDIFPALFSISSDTKNKQNQRHYIFTRCDDIRLFYYIIILFATFFNFGRRLFPSTIFYYNISATVRYRTVWVHVAPLELRFRLRMARIFVLTGRRRDVSRRYCPSEQQCRQQRRPKVGTACRVESSSRSAGQYNIRFS